MLRPFVDNPHTSKSIEYREENIIEYKRRKNIGDYVDDRDEK